MDAVSVAAEGGSAMSDVISAFTTAAGVIVSNLTTLVGDLVPVLLPALALIIVVSMGIRVIKRITGGRG